MYTSVVDSIPWCTISCEPCSHFLKILDEKPAQGAPKVNQHRILQRKASEPSMPSIRDDKGKE